MGRSISGTRTRHRRACEYFCSGGRPDLPGASGRRKYAHGVSRRIPKGNKRACRHTHVGSCPYTVPSSSPSIEPVAASFCVTLGLAWRPSRALAPNASRQCIRCIKSRGRSAQARRGDDRARGGQSPLTGHFLTSPQAPSAARHAPPVAGGPCARSRHRRPLRARVVASGRVASDAAGAWPLGVPGGLSFSWSALCR